MALEDIYRIYPKQSGPYTYTGMFKDHDNRRWSDKPNKHIHGVSYTRYEDAFEFIHADDNGEERNLFEFFHGDCIAFGRYFHELNPDWRYVSLMRGSDEPQYDRTVHSFCTKEIDGRFWFADARGITDDIGEFFSDFRFSKRAYLVDEPNVNYMTQYPCYKDEVYVAAGGRDVMAWAYSMFCEDAVKDVENFEHDEEPEISL